METIGLGNCRRDCEPREVRVVLDTNFIVLLSEQPHLLQEIDKVLLAKHCCVLLTEVLTELERILENMTPTARRRLEFVLQLLSRMCVKDTSGASKGDVDEAIVEYARRVGSVVATNDRELRKKLRKAGIPALYFREESRRLELEGEVF